MTRQSCHPHARCPVQNVKTLPSALVPSRLTLDGQLVALEPLHPKNHLDELYAASHGSDAALRTWDYLPFGPWPSAEA